MRKKVSYHIANIELFKNKIIQWAAGFKDSAIYKGKVNKLQGMYLDSDLIVGVDAISSISVDKHCFEVLTNFVQAKKDWLFGYLSYDLNQELFNIKAKSDDIGFNKLHFFQPKWVFEVKNHELNIYFSKDIDVKDLDKVINEIESISLNEDKTLGQVNIKQRISKESYKKSFDVLKSHIARGDIYEVNYCKEFFAQNAIVNPLNLFNDLYELSEAPFSAFFKQYDKYIICSSPERYLRKIDDVVISQPIKGTRKRASSFEEDEVLKKELLHCPKERSENVMIVDLVRNDLSKTAQKSSVKVEELFGIYSFKQVHQMISTITSKLKGEIDPIDVIKTTFPMGSMTGAPKLSAMRLIEKYEFRNRGVYSGSLGYIKPNGDFDFNVIIRSMVYNSTTKYLSYSVGSAITAQANAEEEYQECLLKSQAFFKVLNAT